MHGPVKRAAVIALAILGLLGGLLHYHDSASGYDGCSYCHAGLQSPVVNISFSLTVPFYEVCGTVDAARPVTIASRLIDQRIPRAPPMPFSFPSF